MRCAYDLTEPARKRIEAERDAEIAAKKAEGKSTRAVAREMDLPQRTVQDVVERNSHRAKSAHQDDPPAEIPGQALHDDMTSPRGERWWGALRALQKVDQQASVEAMMDDRYNGIPATVFDPALSRHSLGSTAPVMLQSVHPHGAAAPCDLRAWIASARRQDHASQGRPVDQRVHDPAQRRGDRRNWPDCQTRGGARSSAPPPSPPEISAAMASAPLRQRAAWRAPCKSSAHAAPLAAAARRVARAQPLTPRESQRNGRWRARRNQSAPLAASSRGQKGGIVLRSPWMRRSASRPIQRAKHLHTPAAVIRG